MVIGRLAGGAAPAKLGGHQPASTTTKASPVTRYSRAKIVAKTRRNGDIRGERKVVSASGRPTAPMLNSVGSAARPRTSPPPFVAPTISATSAGMATRMLNDLPTGDSPRRCAEDIGSKLGRITVTGLLGPNGMDSLRLAERSTTLAWPIPCRQPLRVRADRRRIAPTE